MSLTTESDGFGGLGVAPSSLSLLWFSLCPSTVDGGARTFPRGASWSFLGVSLGSLEARPATSLGVTSRRDSDITESRPGWAAWRSLVARVRIECTRLRYEGEGRDGGSVGRGRRFMNRLYALAGATLRVPRVALSLSLSLSLRVASRQPGPRNVSSRCCGLVPGEEVPCFLSSSQGSRCSRSKEGLSPPLSGHWFSLRMGRRRDRGTGERQRMPRKNVKMGGGASIAGLDCCHGCEPRRVKRRDSCQVSLHT
jgi:hypothetical protein